MFKKIMMTVAFGIVAMSSIVGCGSTNVANENNQADVAETMQVCDVTEEDIINSLVEYDHDEYTAEIVEYTVHDGTTYGTLVVSLKEDGTRLYGTTFDYDEVYNQLCEERSNN